MLRRPASVLLLALLLPASVRSDDDASGSDGTLFFSSYVEGSKFNKAFGIYNPTGSVVNLASYAIQVCFNGCAVDGDAAWSRPFPSGASVATGEEYVVCDAAADDEVLLAMCSTSEEYMSSGNDAIRLVQCATSDCSDFTIIDTLGAFTTAADTPALGWDVCGVTHATKDHTLLRKAAVCAGTGPAGWDAEAEFDTCTWVVYAKSEQFFEVGLHTTTGCTDDGGRHGPSG